MRLEGLLHELEGGKGRNIRDPQRYFFTLFGTPSKTAKWGLSVEGHHLSLNFAVDGDEVVSSTPQFFGANPAIVKTENKSEIKLDLRVLKNEEALAFELVNSLNDEQKKVAIIAAQAPKEIREAGSAQPPQEKGVGIQLSELDMDQKKLLNRLINTYINAVPKPVADQRREVLNKAGRRKIQFAWAGATKPGIGHYYRIQGPTFLIEFVNTQPDPSGNPANHIHAVWRDLRGDFGVPIASE